MPGPSSKKEGAFREFGEPVRELPQAVKDFETTVIPHPNHARVLSAIARAHSRWSPPTSKARLKAQAVLVVGASGAGKSTALEAYEGMFPALRLCDVVDGKINGIVLTDEQVERLQTGDLVRVLLVEAPANSWRERPFVAAIFQALGYKAVDDWHTNKIIEQLKFYAEQLGVELFLIDEGHHLVGGDVINFLKSLLNRIGIPFVIAGLPSLLDVQLDEDDKQMARRSKQTIVLEPYNWQTVTGRVRVMTLIRELEASLKLAEPCLLHEQEKAARLYVAAGGEPGWIAKFMSEALEIALERGLRKLDLEILGEVYDNIFAAPAQQSGDLAFGEFLDKESLEKGVEDRRALNPFLCPIAQLDNLWRDRDATAEVRRRREARDRTSTRKPAGSRATRIRGTGRPPVRAFGKGQ